MQLWRAGGEPQASRSVLSHPIPLPGIPKLRSQKLSPPHVPPMCPLVSPRLGDTFSYHQDALLQYSNALTGSSTQQILQKEKKKPP